jgi:geranylgeranyl diphosphate synthase, type I
MPSYIPDPLFFLQNAPGSVLLSLYFLYHLLNEHLYTDMMEGLNTFRNYFEPKYQLYLETCVDQYLAHNNAFYAITEHLLRIAMGGKRIRAYNVLLAYESVGGDNNEELLPTCFALELYHLFALIHDDIIDRSNERHGVSTLHVAFGTDQALLLGDMCLAWAMKSIMNAPDMTRDIFMRLSEETIIGQMLDVSAIGNLDVSEYLLDTSIEYKTARYTFVYPIMLGISFGKKKIHTKRYWQFGSYLGRAFQRLDDISDIVLNKEQSGKNPCADIMQATPTHLTNYIVRQGTPDERIMLKKYFGMKLRDQDIPGIRNLFINSGAIAYEKKMIAEDIRRAEHILQTLEIGEDSKETWKQCIDVLQGKLETY